MMGGKVQHGRNMENLPIIQLLAYLFSHFFWVYVTWKTGQHPQQKTRQKPTTTSLSFQSGGTREKSQKPPQVVLEFFESVDVDPSEAQYLLEVWKGRGFGWKIRGWMGRRVNGWKTGFGISRGMCFFFTRW